MSIKVKLAGLFIMCSALIFAACDFDSSTSGPIFRVPVLTTADVTEIRCTTAVGGGNITDAGNAEITARGVCWSSTSLYPTIDDDIAYAGTGTGEFSTDITGLNTEATYYVRAFATNRIGTGYGDPVMFTTIDLQALVFIDATNIDDKVDDALEAQGYLTTVVSSASDFTTGITSGQYKLAVLFTQTYSTIFYGFSTSDIEDFINNGGLMIYATWTTSDEDYANIFEASITVNYNLSTVTISDADIIDVAGLSSFTLSNPGWGTYSTGLAAIGDGEVLATFENDEAAMVLGNNGQTIMLGYLSDTVSEDYNQAIFESVVAKVSASQD